jgi:hypothetical protein
MSVHSHVERRRHLRAYIPISVSIHNPRYFTPDDGILQNLSEGGALLACHEHHEEGDGIGVVLHLPGGGDVFISAAVSRRKLAPDDTYVIALSFSSLGPDTARYLDEIVRSEAANHHCRAVLVTDCSPKRLHVLANQLVMRGYRPLLATTALQATTWLEAEADSIVMALVGEDLRSGSAEALLDWLRETHPKLHRARFRPPIEGTKLQRALDRVASTEAPETPWIIE